MSQIFYKSEILDEPIEIDGRKFEKTVRILTYYSQKRISEKHLGFVDVNDIYKAIEKGETINLDHAYVKDFSALKYKQDRGIPETELIELKNFSAKNAYFDCNHEIVFSFTRLTGRLDFEGAIFSNGKLKFKYADFIGDDMNFSECHFNSHHTDFENAEFVGKRISFEHALFSGELTSFINAELKSQNVSFKRVSFFANKVKFHFAEFGDGSISFEKMKFYGNVFDFRRVIFGKGKLDFRRSIFASGHITFEESDVSAGKITFRLSKFEGGDLTFRRMNFGPDEASFDHIDFGCRSISFEGCTANKLSIVNSNIHGNLDLRIKKVNTIDLSESYLHSITDLNTSKKEALDILYIKGLRNLGKMIISWDKNHIKDLILNQPDSTDREISDQFNIIKDNFDQNGQYYDEDRAYVLFKRYDLKADRQEASENRKLAKPFIYIGYALKSLVYDKMGLFATSPSRVFLSMIGAITLFACIYATLHLTGGGEIINTVGAEDNLSLFPKSLYHSAITFFTIGYGDYYPSYWNRFVSASEGYVGVFLMSYFTVAFVRKILR